MAGGLRLCLCVCLFLSLVQRSGGAADSHKKHENDAAHHHIASPSARPAAWNPREEKPKRLFARTRYISTQRLYAPRPKPEPVGAAPVPVRRCAGLMESCSGRTPCCEPCASCHCRLFNTICHCWRLGGCPKKT